MTEQNQPLIHRNRSLQANHINKNIKYPIIQSHIRKSINQQNHIFESRNIITLDGLNSLGSLEEQNSSGNKSSRRIHKRYNKIIRSNRRSKNLLQINNANKIINNNDLTDFNEKNAKMNNKLPNILSIYNKDKVHFFDPLVLDKFNNHYFNKKLKTLDK